MINTENPWKGMPTNSKRLFPTKIINNVYISTIIKNYVFSIFLETEDFSLSSNLKINGILFKKNKNEIHIVLTDNSNWQLFHYLGIDLIKSIDKHFPSDIELVRQLEYRAFQWQELLKKKYSADMPLTLQIGLFSEIATIIESIKIGYNPERILQAWTGPDKAKQDFNFDNILLELKSYSLEKGPLVTITSEYQLYSPEKPLYLCCYALTFSEIGNTIKQQSNFVLSRFSDISLKSEFIKKLFEYGYDYFNPDQKLISFIIESILNYKISENFPKITPTDLTDGLSDVRYKINISKCSSFLINKIPDYYVIN